MDLLSKPLQERVIARLLASGADYAEIFCEDTTRNTITMSDGVISATLSGREYGAALRVFSGLRCAYGYSNDLSEVGLMRLAGQVIGAVTQAGIEKPFILEENLVPNRHAAALAPSALANRQKAQVVRQVSAGAKDFDPHIKNVTVIYRDIDQNVQIATSDGFYCTDRRVYTRAQANVVAAGDAGQETGQNEVFCLAGFECLQHIDPAEIGRRAAQIAKNNLDGVPCPSGSLAVVIAGGVGGTFLHEACGHALEASAIAAQGSYYCGRLGQVIASPKVTAYDSAILPNYGGSYNVDDEGILGRQTLLIENGVLKGYMVDRLNGRRLNMPPSGNGRKQSYRYLTTSRMSNTYIAPGSDREEDIFGDIDLGLYVTRIGGGNASPATGEFSFGVAEGFLIRNGCICEAVRGGTIIGRAAEALLEIDRVGADLGFGFGLCGASSGNVPVGDGAPTIRIRKLTVSGRF